MVLAGGETKFTEETKKEAAFPTKIIPAGKNYLYRQSRSPQTKKRMSGRGRDFQWFALTMGYGGEDTYGPIISTWQVMRDLRLLDLSLVGTRSKLVEEIVRDGSFKMIDAGDLTYKLSFDYQYSGGAFNLEVHKMLLPILRKHGYDGTFVHEEITDDEDGGPTEIVLRRRAWRTRLRRL